MADETGVKDRTAAARAARTRAKHDRWADEMARAGFVVIPPEQAEAAKRILLGMRVKVA